MYICRHIYLSLHFSTPCSLLPHEDTSLSRLQHVLCELCMPLHCLLPRSCRLLPYRGTLSKWRQGIVYPNGSPPPCRVAINSHDSLNRLSLNYAMRNHFLKYAKDCRHRGGGSGRGVARGRVRCSGGWHCTLHCTPHCDKASFREFSGNAASFQRASPRLICLRRRSHAGS